MIQSENKIAFASKNYKSISLSDCNSFADWISLVNADQQYCQNLRYTKPIKKVNKCHLPSWHPYWSKIIKQKQISKKKRLVDIYNLCKKDKSLIKVYFNSSTTLEDIKRKVNEK